MSVAWLGSVVLMDELLQRYFGVLETLTTGSTWHQSLTSRRFGAVHLTIADVNPEPAELLELAKRYSDLVSRADPLRSYAYTMAALTLAQDVPADAGIAAVRDSIEQLSSPRRRMSNPDRVRAIPIMALLNQALDPASADAMQAIHAAWKSRQRWATTGRHFSFAALGACTGLDEQRSAEDADQAHELLAKSGYWDEWDAALLLSFDPAGASTTAEGFFAAADGYAAPGRKPPTVARDDIALVSLSDGDPRISGRRLVQYHDILRDMRPQPSRQVALALSSALILADESPSSGWERTVAHGFAMYAYAEALLEENAD